MVEQGGDTIRFTPPSRERIAGWVVQSLNEISPQTVRRSWRHQPYCLMADDDANNQQQNNAEQQNENNQQQNNDEQQNNNAEQQQNNNIEQNNDDDAE